MNSSSAQFDPPGLQEVCNVVVLYDGSGTRATAMAACDYLIGQFWSGVELKFHWWRMDFLRDATLASVAGDNAVAADFLIVAMNPNQEVSLVTEAWFESWLTQRRGRQGALVDLQPPRGTAGGAWQNFLKEMCRRGNFDYLTGIPEDRNNPANQEAGRVRGDNRDNSRPPSHYGLNE